MIDYETFSALRMSRFFPMATLPRRSAFLEENPGARGYDTEYQGGQWDEENHRGVILWYPEAGAGRLAAVEAWAGPFAQAPSGHEKPKGTFIDPEWSAHADIVLTALGLSVRIGSSEAQLRTLSSDPIETESYDNGAKTSLRINHRDPDHYLLHATVHQVQGLLTLHVIRPDLFKAGCSKRAWKDFARNWKGIIL